MSTLRPNNPHCIALGNYCWRAPTILPWQQRFSNRCIVKTITWKSDYWVCAFLIMMLNTNIGKFHFAFRCHLRRAKTCQWKDVSPLWGKFATLAWVPVPTATLAEKRRNVVWKRGKNAIAKNAKRSIARFAFRTPFRKLIWPNWATMFEITSFIYLFQKCMTLLNAQLIFF